jgi:hypothetical protein
MVSYESEPHGVIETVTTGMRMVGRALRTDLARLKADAEMGDAFPDGEDEEAAGDEAQDSAEAEGEDDTDDEGEDEDEEDTEADADEAPEAEYDDEPDEPDEPDDEEDDRDEAPPPRRRPARQKSQTRSRQTARR